MNDTIQKAKTDFLQAHQGLLQALATTSDDRMNWSSAPSARTPVEIVVHAAQAIAAIHAALDGTAFPFETTKAADRHFREQEAAYGAREAALALLKDKVDAYVAWLDTLDPARLESSPTLPFGGAAPMPFALGILDLHTRYHVAQLDYLRPPTATATGTGRVKP